MLGELSYGDRELLLQNLGHNPIELQRLSAQAAISGVKILSVLSSGITCSTLVQHTAGAPQTYPMLTPHQMQSTSLPGRSSSQLLKADPLTCLQGSYGQSTVGSSSTFKRCTSMRPARSVLM